MKPVGIDGRAAAATTGRSARATTRPIWRASNGRVIALFTCAGRSPWKLSREGLVGSAPDRRVKRRLATDFAGGVSAARGSGDLPSARAAAWEAVRPASSSRPRVPS